MLITRFLWITGFTMLFLDGKIFAPLVATNPINIPSNSLFYAVSTCTPFSCFSQLELSSQVALCLQQLALSLHCNSYLQATFLTNMILDYDIDSDPEDQFFAPIDEIPDTRGSQLSSPLFYCSKCDFTTDDINEISNHICPPN